VGGADAVANAAAVAVAVYPGATPQSRPPAVALADKSDWRAALAASALMGPPIRAPLLLADGSKLPAATTGALKQLQPRGSDALGGGQVARIGTTAKVPGLKTTDVAATDDFALAGAIDRLLTAARGTPSTDVVVVPAQAPAFAMPAAAWAAKSGDPILFTGHDSIPAATRTALRRHQHPRIFVLGPPSAVGPRAVTALQALGTVVRISGPDPVSNAVAFARYTDGTFGWGVVDPGHGLVFANASQPVDAAAAAPLSASGTYGPLLLLDDPNTLPKAVTGYLLDIQPGYTKDPVRGVYNHGWLIGDSGTISAVTQARLDSLLEIAHVTTAPSS
jgi:hypothetical protein